MEENNTVIIELDRPYTLRFGHKALKEYTALTHTTMKNIDESLFDFNNQFAALAIMVKYDCVRNGYPVPTREKLLDLLDEHITPARLFYLVSKTMEYSFTDPDLEAKKPDRAAVQELSGDPQTAAGIGGEASGTPLP